MALNRSANHLESIDPWSTAVPGDSHYERPFPRTDCQRGLSMASSARGGRALPSHWERQLEVDFVAAALGEAKGLSIVDIGSGSGLTTVGTISSGLRLCLCDIDED